MEMHNEIRITGRVGRSTFEILNGVEYERLSVVTERIGRSVEKDNRGREREMPVVYTTWFDCLRRKATTQFEKGQGISLVGWVLGYQSNGAPRYTIMIETAEVVK